MITGAVFGAGLAVTGLALFTQRDANQRLFRSVLAKYVPQVRMSDADLARLVEDYEQTYRVALGRPPETDMPSASMPVDDLGREAVPGEETGTTDWFERRALRHFFMATDFLDAPEADREVRFVASADPYTAGCSNRFARFDFD